MKSTITYNPQQTIEKLIETLQIVSGALIGSNVYAALKEEIDLAIAQAKDEIAKRNETKV